MLDVESTEKDGHFVYDKWVTSQIDFALVPVGSGTVNDVEVVDLVDVLSEQQVKLRFLV